MGLPCSRQLPGDRTSRALVARRTHWMRAVFAVASALQVIKSEMVSGFEWICCCLRLFASVS